MLIGLLTYRTLGCRISEPWVLGGFFAFTNLRRLWGVHVVLMAVHFSGNAAEMCAFRKLA